MTGFDADGWAAHTWVLHSMYENPDLAGLGTHDDVGRHRLERGDIAPVIIGDVDLDAGTTVTGTPLGFVIRPGAQWARVRWTEYLERFPDFTPRHDAPPGDSWFPSGSWPVAVSPPPEGSLDDESLGALLSVLAAHSDGDDTECIVFYGSLPARDFDADHLWVGPLGSIPGLLEDSGGPYRFSPTNFWPVTRDWFVYTDYDLQATKVSGPTSLVSALRADARLECRDWPEGIAS